MDLKLNFKTSFLFGYLLTLLGMTGEDVTHGISLTSSLGDIHHHIFPIISGCLFSVLTWKLSTNEKVLAEVREHFNQIIEQSPSVYELYDIDGLQVEVNQAYVDLWQFPEGRETTVGKFNVLKSKEVEETGLLNHVKKAYSGESVILPPSEFDPTGGTEAKGVGRLRWLSTKIYPVKKQEEVTNIVITHEDITDRIQAEQDREALESQLHQAKKIESIGRLAGGVAHDFNNLIAIISGNVELALTKLASDRPVEKHLLQIKDTATRSAGLTKQLLGFARKQTISPQSLDLNNALEEMLTMLKSLIGEDLELVWSPVKHPLQILIDPTQLDQILTNLVVNARDAMPSQGQLNISTNNIILGEDYTQTHPWCPAGEYVQLRVQDTGCGIPTEIIDHIFEPFYTTKDLGKGTGLGLATIYGIVKQNNGSIDVESLENQGTTVTIYFPQKLSGGDAVSLPTIEPLVPGNESILLVEDDETLLEVAQQILEGLGYHVIATENPVTALSIATAKDERIDLLLTDVIMPKLNGRELAEQIQKIQPQLKILYISGYAADVISTRGLLSKDVQLLQKPFSSVALALKIREVLDSEKNI